VIERVISAGSHPQFEAQLGQQTNRHLPEKTPELTPADAKYGA
jgi:hypothetical protein